MTRQEIRSIIVSYLKNQAQRFKEPSNWPQIQIGTITHLFEAQLSSIPGHKHQELYRTVKSLIQELINSGILYYGTASNGSDGYPWLTITEHGVEALSQEDWLPYDPEGYINALRERVPEIDNVTLAYIGESVAAYNRNHLLSASLTLGVASENIILLLVEAFSNWLPDTRRKDAFIRKTKGRFISTQYKEFKREFTTELPNLPFDLREEWEVYLDGIFNFIRLNRNDAGHPTGKKMNKVMIYANLQVFASYSRYVFHLIQFFARPL